MSPEVVLAFPLLMFTDAMSGHLNPWFCVKKNSFVGVLVEWTVLSTIWRSTTFTRQTAQALSCAPFAASKSNAAKFVAGAMVDLP